jgi:ABC-2 type transport system ATP-binding protein
MVPADSSDFLTIEHLSHQMGAFTLGPIDLELGHGQCTALVGGNGAGKSTLFQCISGLIRPNTGRISVSGSPLATLQNRAQLAYLPERFTPPHYLTGQEYLDYFSALCGARPNSYDELLDMLALEAPMLSKPVRKLSKGTAQKLGIAAVLAVNRPLLLMDEPFSGLDPEARQGLRAAMGAYTRRGGCLFFSSHLFEGMDEYVSRMLILHHGQIRFDGTPSSCREEVGEAALDRAFLRHLGSAAT